MIASHWSWWFGCEALRAPCYEWGAPWRTSTGCSWYLRPQHSRILCGSFDNELMLWTRGKFRCVNFHMISSWGLTKSVLFISRSLGRVPYDVFIRLIWRDWLRIVPAAIFSGHVFWIWLATFLYSVLRPRASAVVPPQSSRRSASGVDIASSLQGSRGSICTFEAVQSDGTVCLAPIDASVP